MCYLQDEVEDLKERLLRLEKLVAMPFSVRVSQVPRFNPKNEKLILNQRKKIMGYDFFVGSPYYRVKKDKVYPVVCDKPWEYKLFKDDVLTKNKNGLFTVHTGICVTALKIPDEDVEIVHKSVSLRML